MSHSMGLPSTHRLPIPTASHPSDRWEALFVYSFIQKFLPQIRTKIDSFESCMDLENALVSSDGDEILRQIIVAFIQQLKPSTRNLRKDQITTTVQSILSDYFKSSEQTVFWDDDLARNVDPFENLQGGLFAANWDLKLRVLRQLVELQLSHGADIKETVDRAWGVVHNKHKKKEEKAHMQPPPPDDPKSMDSLQFKPLGQDSSRLRYWVVDDSPRVYTSSNPWKTSATFRAVCSTREEYMNLIQSLKASAPAPPKGKDRMTKIAAGHVTLIQDLEGRLPAIDGEIQRVLRIRRKLDQRVALQTQAELRQTRTRRQTTRAKYVYDDFGEDEDEGDEYQFQDDDDERDENGFAGSSSRRTSGSAGVRRSARNAGIGQNESPPLEWRGERRSTRLGAPAELQLDYEPLRKRARTEDSATSSVDIEIDIESIDGGDSATAPVSNNNGVKIPKQGAAGLKTSEVAVEQVPGKKRSKYWVYAVENVSQPDTDQMLDIDTQNVPANGNNGNGVEKEYSPSVLNGDRNTSFGPSSGASAVSES